MHHNLKAVQPVPGAILDVVAVVSNPVRYLTRYRLYRNFEQHMLCSGVRLTTVELAYGDRAFEIADHRPEVNYVKLRSPHELWHKENLINIGISRLPEDWQYVAWIDADITFQRPDWAAETIHALQHWDIVQPFSHSLNLGPTYHPLFDSHRKGIVEQRRVVASWLYCHFNQIARHGDVRPFRDRVKDDGLGDDYMIDDPETGHVWHSGFAWAARRSAIDEIGGLLDWAILGSADRHMADMMIGNDTWNPKLSLGYRVGLDIHKKRFDRLNGNFGYVDGLVSHHYHGKLINRMYTDRWKLLFKHQFDPTTDLKRDWQGVYQLTEDKPGLRDDIRRYFRARQEDSIDTG